MRRTVDLHLLQIYPATFDCRGSNSISECEPVYLLRSDITCLGASCFRSALPPLVSLYSNHPTSDSFLSGRAIIAPLYISPRLVSQPLTSSCYVETVRALTASD